MFKNYAFPSRDLLPDQYTLILQVSDGIAKLCMNNRFVVLQRRRPVKGDTAQSRKAHLVSKIHNNGTHVAGQTCVRFCVQGVLCL